MYVCMYIHTYVARNSTLRSTSKSNIRIVQMKTVHQKSSLIHRYRKMFGKSLSS